MKITFCRLALQDKECYRLDQEQCFPEEHRFYEAAHNGLDTMMRRFIREARLLSKDDAADISFKNRRFDYIYQVLGMLA